MSFNMYMTIGSIVLVIDAIAKAKAYNVLWTIRSNSLAGQIHFVLNLLTIVILWPINVVFNAFLVNRLVKK